MNLCRLEDEMDHRQNTGGRGPEVRETQFGPRCLPCWVRESRLQPTDRTRYPWDMFQIVVPAREDEMVLCGNLLRPNGCASEPSVGVHNED